MKKVPEAVLSVGLVIVCTILITTVLLDRQTPEQLTDTRSRAATEQNSVFPTESIDTEQSEKQFLKEIPGFPIYPGSQIEYSYKKRDKKLVGYEVKWVSTATVATITKWYLFALQQSGWTITRVPESALTITPPGPLSDIEFMITAEKNLIQVNLIIENEDGGVFSEIFAEFPLR